MESLVFKRFNQVIVWGFPLHSHTHSYIHGAWVKTFQYLGIPVFWFHDNEYPIDFNYENTCFITEGWADNNIPLNKSSTYFVHIAKNPQKYLSVGSRLIEIRYNVLEIHDFNYDYILPKNALEVSKTTLYEIVSDDSAVALKNGRIVNKQSYEVVYMSWATDLLPHEINLDDASASHEKVVHYIGTISNDHPVQKFRKCVEDAGLEFIHHDPWSKPVSYEENMHLMKKSYCSPDFRSNGCRDKFQQYGKMNGTNHLEIGYIPCRVLKAISYGQTGITNSPRVKELLGDFVEFAERPEDVLPIVEKRKNDVEWRKSCMKHVAENHTFLQRVRDLAMIISMNDLT
jgi:hypothetical protein